jgi:hypothetical protein
VQKALFRALPNEPLEVLVYWKVERPSEVDPVEVERADVLEHLAANLMSALLLPGVEDRLHVVRRPGHGEIGERRQRSGYRRQLAPPAPPGGPEHFRYNAGSNSTQRVTVEIRVPTRPSTRQVPKLDGRIMKHNKQLHRLVQARAAKSRMRQRARLLGSAAGAATLGGALLLGGAAVPNRADALVINTTESDTVEITAGDFLDVTASGSITSAGEGVRQRTSGTTIGDITNDGEIDAGTDAITIYSSMEVSGDITISFSAAVIGDIQNQNGGIIDGNSHGIAVRSGSIVEGNVDNAGTIEAGGSGSRLRKARRSPATFATPAASTPRAVAFWSPLSRRYAAASGTRPAVRSQASALPSSSPPPRRSPAASPTTAPSMGRWASSALTVPGVVSTS